MVRQAWYSVLTCKKLNHICRLCEVRFTTVKADIDLSGVTVNGANGDFNATSLAHVINTPTVNSLVVHTWLDKAGLSALASLLSSVLTPRLHTAGRRSTLIFCVNLAHVRDLTDAFRAAGVDARYVYASTPAKERKTLIEAFKAGEYPVLINCGKVDVCGAAQHVLIWNPSCSYSHRRG
jgi:ATP-dependent helicase IRC3